MDTANFINVEVRVCYSFWKHSIFSAKAKELFAIVWIIEEILKTGNAFLQFDFQKLSYFRFVHKDNAKWHSWSSRSPVLLLFTRFLWHCVEISVYGSNKVYGSQPDILGCFAYGPARTFSDAVPCKGLTSQQHACVSQGQVCLDSCASCHTEIEVSDHSSSPSHSILTPDSPVPALILERQVPSRPAAGILVWLDLEKDLR